jgi:protein-S-isoprenylcysteine O-methyltransferase Ste14
MLVWLSRWRVDLGTVLVPVAIAVARPAHSEIVRLLPVVLAGLAIRLWARGHLDRRNRLTTTGPYALARHPLYVGSFLIGIGFAGMLGIRFVPPLFAVGFLAMYIPKAIREERHLRGKYGEAYARYAARVGPLFPKPWSAAPPPAADGPPVRFAWHRVMRHREWKTWLGVAAALGALWIMASISARAAAPRAANGPARAYSVPAPRSSGTPGRA